MDFNNIAGFALVGSIFAFFNQIKDWLYKFISIFIRTDSFPIRINAPLLVKILSESKIIRWGNSNWGIDYFHFKEAFMVKPATYRIENKLYVLYKNKIPLILSNNDQDSLHITYIFKTINLFEIAKEIDIKRNSETEKYNGSFWIEVFSGNDNFGKNSSQEPFDLNSKFQTSPIGATASQNTQKQGRPFNPQYIIDYTKFLSIDNNDIVSTSNISYDYEARDMSFYWSEEALRLKSELSFFRDNIIWFRTRGIPAKRGILLYGDPGVGKSKMVLECAKDLKLPIIKLEIGNMSNSEFTAFINYHQDSPRIILIEDIDAVFNGRTNLLSSNNINKQLLSFDVFINAISGIKSLDKAVLIITTNNPTVLDQALTRDGRIDMEIHVKTICEAGRFAIAKNILRDWPDIIEQTVKCQNNTTAAEFTNNCIKLAISKFYEDRDKKKIEKV